MTLPPHSPSSPTRPPVEHLYFTIHNEEGEEVRFFTHGFGAMYAVKHWLDEILDPHPDIKEKWMDNGTILLRHKSGYTLTIKGSHLEEAVDYQLNKEEKQWTIPYPDSAQVEKLTTFWNPRMAPSSHLKSSPENESAESKPTKTSTKKPSKPKPAPRHRSQKPSPDGTITVAQICAELNIQPNKGRQILRKAKIQKPAGGWTYKLDDPTLTTIRELLSKG